MYRIDLIILSYACRFCRTTSDPTVVHVLLYRTCTGTVRYKLQDHIWSYCRTAAPNLYRYRTSCRNTSDPTVVLQQYIWSYCRTAAPNLYRTGTSKIECMLYIWSYNWYVYIYSMFFIIWRKNVLVFFFEKVLKWLSQILRCDFWAGTCDDSTIRFNSKAKFRCSE